MTKARKAYKELIILKQKELENYYRQHRDIIKPFIELRDELIELKSKEIYVSIEEAKELMKR